MQTAAQSGFVVRKQRLPHGRRPDEALHRGVAGAPYRRPHTPGVSECLSVCLCRLSVPQARAF